MRWAMGMCSLMGLALASTSQPYLVQNPQVEATRPGDARQAGVGPGQDGGGLGERVVPEALADLGEHGGRYASHQRGQRIGATPGPFVGVTARLPLSHDVARLAGDATSASTRA